MVVFRQRFGDLSWTQPIWLLLTEQVEDLLTRSGAVLATVDIRSKTRKETASEKLSRYLLDVKMARKRNG